MTQNSPVRLILKRQLSPEDKMLLYLPSLSPPRHIRLASPRRIIRIFSWPSSSPTPELPIPHHEGFGEYAGSTNQMPCQCFQSAPSMPAPDERVRRGGRPITRCSLTEARLRIRSYYPGMIE